MFEGVAADETNWQSLGACVRLEDASVMFPTGNVDPAALRACASCPVFARCRAWADEIEGDAGRDSISGFLAGETVLQRVARRQRARAAERVLAHA